MEVPEPKPNVITTQSRLSKWIFQRGPGFKLSSFKDSTRSVTGAFKAARQPSRHLEPTRTHRLRALAYWSPLYSPQLETLLEQRASAGVAFVINKNLIAPRDLTKSELIEGHVLAIKFKWHEDNEIVLINVYAPNNRTSHLEF